MNILKFNNSVGKESQYTITMDAIRANKFIVLLKFHSIIYDVKSENKLNDSYIKLHTDIKGNLKWVMIPGGQQFSKKDALMMDVVYVSTSHDHNGTYFLFNYFLRDK